MLLVTVGLVGWETARQYFYEMDAFRDLLTNSVQAMGTNISKSNNKWKKYLSQTSLKDDSSHLILLQTFDTFPRMHLHMSCLSRQCQRLKPQWAAGQSHIWWLEPPQVSTATTPYLKHQPISMHTQLLNCRYMSFTQNIICYLMSQVVNSN